MPELPEYLQRTARTPRWLVILLAALFTLSSLVQTGPMRSGTAQAAESSVDLSLKGGMAMTPGHAKNVPTKHLPVQSHDAKTGSCYADCQFCAVLPAAAEVPLRIASTAEAHMAWSQDARAPLPLLPPPKLHA